MADDQNPQDPQIPVSTTDQSASSDTNRPDSTIMADSNLPPADSSQSTTTDDRPISTNLADPTTTSADPTNPTSDSPAVPIEPVSTISTDPSQVPADLSAEAQAQVASPPVSVSPAEPPAESVPPTPVPEETSSPSQTPISPSPVVSIPDLSTPSDLSNPLSINVSPPEIKPVEVQSDAPNSIPTITQSQQVTESASIKPEPMDSSQNAPLADSDSTKSTPTTFRDLLSDSTNPPSSPPPAPSSPDLSNLSTPGNLPSSSFGDLIKNIKPEDSVIQPPSTPPTPPPVSSNPPPITNNLPAQTGNSQPISSPLPISPISPNLSVNRIKANQVRVQKRNNHLEKIIELAKTKGKITNKDIREILRVSQSTATNYLSELLHRGSLKIEKHAKATFYTI